MSQMERIGPAVLENVVVELQMYDCCCLLTLHNAAVRPRPNNTRILINVYYKS
jgi:hypothetical protein